MATKNLSKEEKLTAEEKMIGTVSNFFQKNRILVIIIATVIVVGLITAIITVNAINNAKEKAQIRITELEQEYANMLAEETPELLDCCDTDGDGEITVADALKILRVAAKLTDEGSLA